MSYPGKIYRITYQGCNAPYYGSTKDPINWRFNHHKTAYKQYLQGNANYCQSYKILENENCYIELVENYNCKDREELEQKEQYYIDNNVCVNTSVASKKNSKKKRYDYNNGKIYMITYDGCEYPYIGHTIQTLNRRFTSGHKCKYKNYLNNNNDYCASFEILKYKHCYIKLIENYPCENLKKLREREQYHIDNNQCCNKSTSFSSDEKLKQKNKNRVKKYRKKNKNEINKKRREKYQENKNELSLKGKEKIKCECGAIICRSSLTKHKKRIVHIQAMQEINNKQD